ncbi:MAG: adenylate kinase family protein [Patescibacteria group bacterium]
MRVSKKKILNFVLIGPPGSGKGTQAKLLVKNFPNSFYVSSGQLFRKLSKEKTDVGQRIKTVVESGGLPFDDLATTLWMYEIAFKVKKNQGIVADGFPRRLQEAKDLDAFLEFLDRKRNTYFLLIDISEKEALKRLPKRGRADDEIKDIKKRFRIYKKRTIPAINYFKKQGRLIKINGEQSIENVFKDILRAISLRNYK